MWNSGTQEMKWGILGSHEQSNPPTRITTTPLDQIHINSVNSVSDFLSFIFIPAVLRESA